LKEGNYIKICEKCGSDTRVCKNNISKEFLCYKCSKIVYTEIYDLKCSNCNSNHNVKLYNNEIYLCEKHYAQMRLYNKILDRTINDPNEIILYDDYAEMIIYNVECEEVARTKISLNKVEFVKQHKWCLDGKGYIWTSFNNRNLKLHRFITNADKSEKVDHINGDPLNNLDENLRRCTQQQNSFNSKLSKNNTSGVTGVIWREDRNKWIAQIMVNRKCIRLGSFDNFEKAVEIRAEAEIKYFGEYRYIKGCDSNVEDK